VASSSAESTTTTTTTTTLTSEAVPAEIVALDGIESEDEAHNSERPARKSLKKKTPSGKALTELVVGETIRAKVKSITSYGAFMDIGAVTDGLLHISQLSADYVSDVKSVIQPGVEYEVRILSIDEKKNQVALTLLTQAQEDTAKDQQQQARARPQRNNNSGSNSKRDEGAAVLNLLAEKGWDSSQFVEGTVVSTVDFGAFVRVDVSKLNAEVVGEIDGLVHISALAPGRVDSVTSVVKVDDKVQVRVKDFSGGKVSLSMVSVADEQDKRQSSGGGGGNSGGEPVREGNKNWKEDLEKLTTAMPTFVNKPIVVDTRK
jgi:predicted RNA-binding protein with RPS1 domain